MPARAIMIQGTGSDVGKSLLVAGLCRAFAQQGMRVLPFKPQNMSNHAAVSDCGGGEIGRAQWLQARACGVPTSVHMNPVLLKPEADHKSQLVVQGKRVGQADAAYYRNEKAKLLAAVMESYHILSAQADLIVIEGAGSPAEINLRTGDIANMGFAQAMDIPVILAGDIERGGIIASMVGTHAVLDDADRKMIEGFIINKFRGDVRLFDAGVAEIEARTGWAHLGTLPYLSTLHYLPKEDGYSMRSDYEEIKEHTPIKIAVVMLPHLSNADDFDPLRAEPDVALQWVRAGDVLPMDADLVILPGTKSTIADLQYLKAQGLDYDLHAYVRRGGRVLGICGGYQMLGKLLDDPQGLDGAAGQEEGLGLLNIHTQFTEQKKLTQWQGKCALSGVGLNGYHMHMGHSEGADCARPIFLDGDSASSQNGRVAGCYIHGLFADNAYRHAFLSRIRARGATASDYAQKVEDELNLLAEAVAAQLHLAVISDLARTARTVPQSQAG